MICEICGIEFTHSKLTKTCCSKKCMEKKYYLRNKERISVRNKKKYLRTKM